MLVLADKALNFIFFFNDTATTEIYTLSLHDALPICPARLRPRGRRPPRRGHHPQRQGRSEEHTSELQSHLNIVCRLLLEKKKKHGEKNVVSKRTGKVEYKGKK